VDEFPLAKEVYSGEPMKQEEGDNLILNETSIPYFDLRLSLTPPTDYLVLTSVPLSLFGRLLLWIRSNFALLTGLAILHKYLSKETQ
jgi:hypothetical protein